MGARTQQPYASLIPNLDASTCEQRHPAAQIGNLGPFAEVQVGAFRAKLVVEMMKRRVVAFADIAVLWLARLAKIQVVLGLVRLDRWRRKRVGCGEHAAAAQFPDSGLIEDILFPMQFFCLALAYPGLEEPSLLFRIGQEYLARSFQEAGVFLRGKLSEDRAVGRNLFQDLDGGAQLFRCVVSVHR